MRKKLIYLPALVCALLMYACAYIVLPEDVNSLSSNESRHWSAVATNISKSETGDLHIDLAIRNDTAEWSAMQAAPNKPAALTGGGKSTNCDTVFIGTGGHRIAPGFQMRGFTTGTKSEPNTQLLYVECKGAEISPGSKLLFDYSYVTGEYNYYYPEENKVNSKMEVNLDELATNIEYPIGEPVEGLLQSGGVEIIAINDVVLTLTGITRTEQGFDFNWKTANPGEYPSYVHIGIPPVIGEDGICYGIYESPDIASVPVTPAGGEAEWATSMSVPADVNGFYILLSVESKKQRLFVNYALDITNY